MSSHKANAEKRVPASPSPPALYLSSILAVLQPSTAISTRWEWGISYNVVRIPSCFSRRLSLRPSLCSGEDRRIESFQGSYYRRETPWTFSVNVIQEPFIRLHTLPISMNVVLVSERISIINRVRVRSFARSHWYTQHGGVIEVKELTRPLAVGQVPEWVCYQWIIVNPTLGHSMGLFFLRREIQLLILGMSEWWLDDL